MFLKTPRNAKTLLAEIFFSMHELLRTKVKFLSECFGTGNLVTVILFGPNIAVYFVFCGEWVLALVWKTAFLSEDFS